MKRKDFIQIIKLRSAWKIDHRKGNYELPSGKKLDAYIIELVESQMKIDSLGIMKNGDLCPCEGGGWNTESKNFNDFILSPDFEEKETCSYDDMERRIERLVSEIVG